MIIALEGIDGSGKTTQAFLLENELNAKTIKFPDYNRFPQIKDYLEGKTELDKRTIFLLFLADIIEGTKNENNLIIDRYFYSTLAYTTINFNAAKAIIKAVKPKKADYVFLLDITAEEGMRRKQKIKQLDKYEKDLAFLEQVRQRYLSLAEEQFMGNWFVIDGTKKPMDIFNEIKIIIQEQGKH